MRPGRILPGLVLASGLAVAACGGQSGNSGEEVVRVFAAASLTEAFTQIGSSFEKAHPGARVDITFAGSSALGRQVRDGAPADVFAPADPADLAGLDLAAPARDFARNRLALVVERGNPEGIDSLADLADPALDLDVVRCAPEVPCGRLAGLALSRAGVELRPASLEEHVKAVVAKVVLGEADAGLVYATDAQAAAADIDTVEPTDLDPSIENRYAIAVLSGPHDRGLATEFVEHVLAGEAQAILRRFGFH